MGVATETHGERGGIGLVAPDALRPEAPYELVKTMRASVLVLGPLLARFGQARCRCPAAAPSARARWTSTSRACRPWAPRSPSSTATWWPAAGRPRLRGARITTDMVTVTGTENLLMAACLAEGETVLENAAQEPEVADLAEMLIKMGARSRAMAPAASAGRGAAARLHAPRGGRPHRGRHLPVRVAATGGDALLRHARRPPGRGDRQAARGRRARRARGGRRPRGQRRRRRLKAQGFRTTEYPGFPTDMQAQFMALNLVARAR
jgi:UDP-N-acetylglucosamine 1-carboxyvinyltransferase